MFKKLDMSMKEWCLDARERMEIRYGPKTATRGEAPDSHGRCATSATSVLRSNTAVST